MDMTRTVNVGLIGGGMIARAHAIGYASVRSYFGESVPHVRLRRVAEVNEDLARAAADRFGFEEWTTDWEELIGSPDIDLVSITTPNFLHAPMSIAAAKAGKHILCEKPMATNAAECETMYRAAEEAGVIHAVNYNYRQVPAIQWVRRLIESGKLGTIREFRGSFLQDWGNDARIPRSWKFEVSRSGGGSILGVGTHIIDMAHFLVGEMSQVIGTSDTWVRERPIPTSTDTFAAVAPGASMAPVDTDDSTYFLGRFRSGAVGTFGVSRCATGRKNPLVVEIYGTEGSVTYDYERSNEVQLNLSDSKERDTEGFRTIIMGPAHDSEKGWGLAGLGTGFAETVLFQIRDVLTAIDGGPRKMSSFYDGWRAQTVIDAVKQSARSGKWVQITPASRQAN